MTISYERNKKRRRAQEAFETVFGPSVTAGRKFLEKRRRHNRERRLLRKWRAGNHDLPVDKPQR